MPELNMVDAIHDALTTAMEADDTVMILGEDVGNNGGVFRATDGLQAKFGEDRVVDTPLAEGVIAGAAVGLAIAGMTPIAEIQFLGFAHQAYHQIADQIARYRSRSQGRFNLPIVIRSPFGGGVRTPELHSDALEAQFVHCPGLKVVCPATAHDAKGLLLASIADPDPVLFLEPLRGYRLVSDDVPEEAYTVEIGKARVVRTGTDITLIGWSAGVFLAEKAADVLAKDGISAGVVDIRTLAPLDIDTIVAEVAATGRAVIVQEAAMTCGFGAEVAATLAAEAFFSLESPITRVGSPDAPYPLPGLEKMYIPDVAAVVAGAKAAMEAV